MVSLEQAGLQQQRILRFCREANPWCRVEFEECAIGRIKPVFHIPGSSPIVIDYAISADVLARLPDEGLWYWLGAVTGGMIMRPALDWEFGA
jgi:hypothetical protein